MLIEGRLLKIDNKLLKKYPTIKTAKAYWTGMPGYVNFEVITDKKWSDNKASSFQKDMNYHPAGYAFYGFTEKKISDGYIYTWKCRTSAD